MVSTHAEEGQPSIDGRFRLERTVTFLCGAPGALAIAAVIYTNFGDQRMVDRCVDK